MLKLRPIAAANPRTKRPQSSDRTPAAHCSRLACERTPSPQMREPRDAPVVAGAVLVREAPSRGRVKERHCRTHEPAQYGDRAFRSCRNQLHTRESIALRPCIREIEDCALIPAFYGGMGRIDKALQMFGQPVIASCLTSHSVHALLHDTPMTVGGGDEAMEIELKAILHCRAVDFGYQPACSNHQLHRRLARLRAFSAQREIGAAGTRRCHSQIVPRGFCE